MPFVGIDKELTWEHKKNAGDRLILQQRIDCALRMAFHHGRTQFEKLFDEIKSIGHNSDLTFDMLLFEVSAKQHQLGMCHTDTQFWAFKPLVDAEMIEVSTDAEMAELTQQVENMDVGSAVDPTTIGQHDPMDTL
jgi:hypothetical protein